MAYNTKLRLTLFLLLFVGALTFFTVRLYSLQVVNNEQTTSGSGTFTYDTRVRAARGEILDRNGNVLVSNRASYDLIITNYALFNAPDPNESLRQLVALGNELGVEFTDHLPITKTKPYAYTEAASVGRWSYYFSEFLSHYDWDPDIAAPQLFKLMRARFHIPNDWTDEEVRGVIGIRYELDLRYYTALATYTLMEDVDATQLAELMELSTPGMSVMSSTVREYSTQYAAHILGRIGSMDPDEYEELKDQGYAMDAYVGKDGLEKVFEKELHGTDGLLRTTVDRDGNVLNQTYVKAPVAGNNVELTLDIDLQMSTEKALEATILNLRETGVNGKHEGEDAKGGAAVVIDVHTGEVLACASYPTYDISTYSENFNELAADPYSPLFNRALGAAYPPGSTFKMVTSIAALQSDKGITRLTPVEDRGIYTYYDDYQPACYYYTSYQMTHGIVNVEKALAVSCNYYFYEVGRMIGWRQIDKVAKAFGLGESTGIELPEEIGHRGNPDTKKELYADYPELQAWTGGDTLSLAIGQSECRFTPLQLAVYTAALANGGTRYRATFLSRIISSDYQDLIYQTEPEVMSKVTITDEAYQAYTTGMRMAVTDESGTANKVFGDYEIPVCAKTGTAQHGSAGSDHASYVCYAPADDPQIAISVYVENGAQGGVLGNVAKAIFDVYFATVYQNDVVQPENAPN